MKDKANSKVLHGFLALIVACLIIFAQSRHMIADPSEHDANYYTSTAKDLVDTGVFTDGCCKEWSFRHGAKGQGMFFAPLYPALVAGAMKLDPGFYQTVSCHLSREHQTGQRDCPMNIGVLRVFQTVLAVLSAFLVWFAGLVITGRLSIAWLAMILALSVKAYAYWSTAIMTEILVFPLFTLATSLYVLAYKKQKLSLWWAAGGVLALAALTKPSFSYLFYALIPLSAGLAFYTSTDKRKFLLVPLTFILGFSCVAGPWIVRNGLALGKYDISGGYASFILVQRVAYNEMSWSEWGAFFVYGLPDFGDKLAKKLFDPESYERLDYADPKGFYQIGNNELRDQTIKDAGGLKNHLSYLLHNYVLKDLFKHIMVTLPLAWRGMWIGKYWGLVAIPVFAFVFVYAARRRWAEYILFALPPWFMVGFHAFTSVSVPRYNLILIPCLAIALAFALVKGWDRIAAKQKKKCHEDSCSPALL